MTRKNAWIVAVFLGIAVFAFWLFSFFPLFGALSFLVLPTLIVVSLAAGIGAFTSLVVRVEGRTYFLVVIGAFVLLTIAGAYLRQQGDSSGSAGVSHASNITRPVVARLREPVRLDSDGYVGYDRAMFDSVQPWCRDPCVIFERVDWYRRHVFEVPKDLLEDIGVKPLESGDARITVRIEEIERQSRIEIVATVVEAGTTTASWQGSLPASDRKVSSALPLWLHYALENNPLAAALTPKRRYLDQKLLETFLRSAIVLNAPSAAPVVEIEATELTSQVLSPALKVDRSDPEYIKWWFTDADQRCEGVVSTERRAGIAGKYVAFAASDAAAPQLRIGNESLICAGDAVYVHRYGRVPIDVLDFSRYSLSGEHTADLRIRVPKHAVTTFIAFDMQSVSERAGKVTFVVRNVRFKWAKDVPGMPLRKPSGEMFEYAIIDRQGEYAAVLPAHALGNQ